MDTYLQMFTVTGNAAVNILVTWPNLQSQSQKLWDKFVELELELESNYVNDKDDNLYFSTNMWLF